MTSVLIKMGNLDTDTRREDDVTTQGEDGHLKANDSINDGISINGIL